MDEQRTQVGVAAFGDAQEPLFPTARVLARRQPQVTSSSVAHYDAVKVKGVHSIRPRARAIHWRYDAAIPDYRRAHVPGGTYFFTVNTYRRQTILTDAVRSALREAIGTLRLASPFVIQAWVLLPEHMHAL